MNKHQFETLTNTIYTRLEKRRAPNKSATLLTAKTVDRIGVVAMVAIPIVGSVASMMMSHGNTIHSSIIIGTLLGGTMYGLTLWGDYGRGGFDKGKEPLSSKLADRMLAVFGKSAPLDPDAAGKISHWARQYPRLRDICIKWGGSNKDMMLNRDDYRKLKGVVKKIEAIETRYQRSINDQNRITEILSRDGLLEQIQLQGANTHLKRDTQEAKATTQPRRI